jgi:(p)ppGpp synthase/HD superfamily hydrolase
VPIVNSELSVSTEPQTDSDLATAALRLARRVHLGQYRKQTYDQFIEHPIAVARLLSDVGADHRMLAAAYLHDVVEKTSVEQAEIDERFGPAIGAIVAALTDDPAIDSYAERKRALRLQVLKEGRETVLIYAADRLANMRDWRTVEPGKREDCAGRLGTRLGERLELWDEDLRDLTDYDSELPFLAEIETQLRVLRTEAA